eukprot:tig00020538_g10332.t1
MGGNNSTLNCFADKACKVFIDTAASNAACKKLGGVAVINNGPKQSCKAIQLDEENMVRMHMPGAPGAGPPNF